METAEREEQASGASISIKRSKKSKGKAASRQTTLTASCKSSIELTKPSPFAEFIDPKMPEYNANPKAARPRAKKKTVESNAPKQSSRGKKSASQVSDEKPASEKMNFSDYPVSLAKRRAKTSTAGDSKTHKLNFKKTASNATPSPPIQCTKRAINPKKYASSDDNITIEDDSELASKKATKRTRTTKSESLSFRTVKVTKATASKISKAPPKKIMSKKPRIVLRKTTSLANARPKIEDDKPAKKAQPKPSSLDSTDDEAPPTKKQAVDKPKRKTFMLEHDSLDEFIPSPLKKPKTTKSKPPPAKAVAVKPRKKAKSQKKIVMKKSATKKSRTGPTHDEILADNSDTEEEVLPLGKRVAAPVKPAPSKMDSTDDKALPTKKQAVDKPKRKTFILEHDFSDDFTPSPPKKPKTTKSKPPLAKAVAAKPRKKARSQKKIVMKKSATKKSRTGPTHDEILVDNSEEVLPLGKRVATPVKPAPSKMDSTDDKALPTKKQAVDKPKRKTFMLEHDSSGEFTPLPLKKPKTTKSKPPPAKAVAVKPRKKAKSQKEIVMKKSATKKSRTGPTHDEILADNSDTEEEVLPLGKRVAAPVKPAPSKTAATAKPKAKVCIFTSMHVSYLLNTV